MRCRPSVNPGENCLAEIGYPGYQRNAARSGNCNRRLIPARTVTDKMRRLCTSLTNCFICVSLCVGRVESTSCCVEMPRGMKGVRGGADCVDNC